MKTSPSPVLSTVRSSRLDTVIIGVIVSFAVCHWYLLPLSLSYDSYLYLDQAEMLFNPRFVKDWHFLRTPLFQMMLRVLTEIFGHNACSIATAPVVLGTAGMIMFYLILRSFCSSTLAAVAVIITSLNPYFIAYQHMILTESGTFLFIACIVVLLLRRVCVSEPPYQTLFGIGAVIALGYYFRPTLIYLAYVVFMLFLFISSYPWKKRLAAVIPLVIFPLILSMPWRMLGSTTEWQRAQILFGIVNQAIPSPDSQLLGSAREPYVNAIQRALSPSGRLTSSGILDSDVYVIAGRLDSNSKISAETFLARAILESPLRYMKGCLRGIALLLGVPGLESDNRALAATVLSREELSTHFFPGPAHLSEVARSRYSREAPKSPLGKFLWSIVPTYEWAYRLGSVVAVIALPWAAIRRDHALLIFLALPLFFAGYHALVLFSVDRMAIPIQSFIIASPFIVFVRTREAWRKRKALCGGTL